MVKPNVILVILDTVRAKNMSCYGYHRDTTPFLNELSSQANLFKNAFTPAIWTIPSHATIFTGTYPSKHGALNLNRYLDTKYTTLAELFSIQGYDTIALANNYFISQGEFGLSRGFSSVLNHNQYYAKRVIAKGLQWFKRSADTGAYLTNRIIRKKLSNKTDSARPFFLFLNYMEAHAPYIHINKNYLRKFLSQPGIRRFKKINQDRQMYLTRTFDISEDDFSILRSVYDAQITYLDAILRELINTLKNTGTFDNSIIIITSDHGDMIGEHRLMHHSYSVYEELIKVPLLVKLPGKDDNGKSYDYLVSLIDIFPTLADLLEIKPNKNIEQLQGCNLFANNDRFNREYVFAECERPKNEFLETYPDFDFSVYDRQLLAIRSKKFKYIWASNGKHQLFNLKEDPSEKENIADKKPLIKNQLKDKLFSWYNSFEKASFIEKNTEEQLDTKVKEHLRGLGYF
jgi:arylsulfatase A-like enzyme